jgi:hypothetical protein
VYVFPSVTEEKFFRVRDAPLYFDIRISNDEVADAGYIGATALAREHLPRIQDLVVVRMYAVPAQEPSSCAAPVPKKKPKILQMLRSIMRRT